MKKFFAIAFLSLVIFPSFVFAADSLLTPYWGPIVSCVGGASTKGLPTCTSLCDLFSTAQNVLRLGVTIALYIMVPIYVLYGGFKVATTGISGDKIATVRKMFFEILIGIIIILGSFTIINTFMNGLAGVLGGKNETSTWLKISCFRQGTEETTQSSEPKGPCPGSKGCPECNQSSPPAYCK
jgi:hypothetical protein